MQPAAGTQKSPDTRPVEISLKILNLGLDHVADVTA
jgi:hypothetical protein